MYISKMFMSSLDFAIKKSGYTNINFKPKQVVCLEAIFNRRDTVAVLPTGYGKSLIYQILPPLLSKRNEYLREPSSVEIVETPAVVIVVSPLNSLIDDQINKISECSDLKATVLKAKREDETNDALLQDAKYDIVFRHPEACLSSKEGLTLLQSDPYKKCVQAIVVDEAHCILEWGDDFRTDFAQLGMLCALFPSVPVLALTATASKKDRDIIKKTLHMRTPLDVVVSPNRVNIFYDKVFRLSSDIEAYENILEPIAENLLKQKIDYPLTIIYMSLKWCGFAYRLFDRILASEQYYPADADPAPENRLFSQFHSPQTTKMKEQILKELALPASKLRVVFATVAMGMGVDIPSIRQIIHIGPPRTIREYMQETGRAGRDGYPSTAVLYYNNNDIAVNRKGISDKIREYCHLDKSCMRKFLLNCLDAEFSRKEQLDKYLCCSHCSSTCE